MSSGSVLEFLDQVAPESNLLETNRKAPNMLARRNPTILRLQLYLLFYSVAAKTASLPRTSTRLKASLFLEQVLFAAS